MALSRLHLNFLSVYTIQIILGGQLMIKYTESVCFQKKKIIFSKIKQKKKFGVFL